MTYCRVNSTLDTSAANAAIDLTGVTVDGNFALGLSTGTGAVTTNTAMGANTALASLDINSTGQTNIGANITTQGATGVLLDGATNVDLTADVTIDTSAGNGAVNVGGGAVDGTQALTINAGTGAVTTGAMGTKYFSGVFGNEAWNKLKNYHRHMNYIGSAEQGST